MDDEIIDFGDERSRHGHLFGREDVLAKIRSWLIGERALARGWVLLSGGPGVGKSAIVTRILNELPEPIPHHFIRRGNEGWDRPEVIVQNLCAQIERNFSERANAELSPEARLTDILKRLSRHVLAPRNRRLVMVIDGLDEVASDGDSRKPSLSFLPRMLPSGVVILCASRSLYPNLAWHDERVCHIDLDDASSAASNEAACRAFWEYHAKRFSPPLDSAVIEEAVQRAGGNMLHARRLRDWLEDQPPERRTATAIPVGLDGFLIRIWADLHDLDGARRTLVTRGLGLACAAREALPSYLFSELLGGSTSEGEDFLRVTRPFLREEHAHWHDARRAYRPYHEHFREFITDQIGPPVIREHHLRIAEALAAWPPSERDPARRTYALRHAVAHRIEAGDVGGALRLCTDVGYLEAKCSALGIPAIERDLEAAIRVADGNLSLDLAAILAAVSAESGKLREHPTALATLLYNRLRCAGWPEDRIERVLRFDGGAPRLRLLHGVRLGLTLLRAFAGHAKPIVACAATPDGSHILSASADRTLRLWAAASGECIGVLEGHDDEITACAVSRDGRLAVSTSVDMTARLWDLTARRCLAIFGNHGRWATTCAVTVDGRHLVVGSDIGTITVWDHTSRQPIGALAGHTDYVTACLVTPDDHIVSASRDGSVRVWDLASRSCSRTLVPTEMASSPPPRGMEEKGWITALALGPDGRHVLAATGDGSLSRWDLDTGRCVQRFGAGQGRVDACVFLYEGHSLLCGMADGSLVIWDLTTEQRVLCRPAHQGAVSACATTSAGRQILSGSSDRLLKLWEIGGPESLMGQEGHEAPITACALTPDGSVAVSASEDHTLKVWDVASGACRLTLEGHEDLVTACAISADGRHVLSGARDGSVRRWSIDVGGVEIGERHWALVSGAAILPKGAMLTTTQNGAVWIHDGSILEPPRELGLHEGSVDHLAVTPDGTHALSISRGGTAKVWNVAARRCERTLTGFAAPVLAGALTPDGRRAVLALADGRLEVREVHGQKPVRFITGHEQRIFGCAVSPDGERVISASEDGTLRVFGLSTGQCLGVIHGTSWFRCVAVVKGRICAGDQEGNLWMIVDDTGAPNLRRLSAPDEQAPSLDPRELSRLRRALAKIYDRPESARLVARDAGLDFMRIIPTGSVEETWDSLLAEALKRRRLAEVVRCALRAYPEDPDLRDLAALLGLR